METSATLLTKIENKEIVLPEFQREFTWKKKQTLDLIDSLLKEYPIGSLLLWKTKAVPALKNMPDFVPDGRVEVLLDGQQRLTALYLLIKGEIPPYYSEKDIESGKDPRNLYYNLETRALGYYKEMEMGNNPRWVRVLDCFSKNKINIKEITNKIAEPDDRFDKYDELNENFRSLSSISDKDHSLIYVKEDSNLKHALTVFDRVNSGGTPLGEADIALAHMCSHWADTRRAFKEKLNELEKHGFQFDLTFLIRAMNAVINCRAEYKILHDNTEEDLKAGWKVLNVLLDYLINVLKDRAFIYSTDDLRTFNVLIPVLGYLAQNELKFQDDRNLRKLLYWMYAALYQSRYGGSVDQKLEKDLGCLSSDTPLDDLIAVLKEDQGDPRVSAQNLDARGVSHPFYNMSSILIRSKGGVDWSNGLILSKPIGQKYSIERHHIFPRTILTNEGGYDPGKNLMDSKRVNEIANRVPLTKSGNMDIFYSKPIEYLPKVQKNNPGNLERFMIPMDEELWDLSRYEDFLEERRNLIADSINEFMTDLLEEKSNDQVEEKIATKEIIKAGESDNVEFKSTLRWHVYAERIDKEMEHAVLKTIAAFLNTDGGTLLVGVEDDGKIFGIEKDSFENDDKYGLHLINLIKDKIGVQHIRFIKFNFEEIEGKKIVRIDCKKSVVPAYLKKDNSELFYVRSGPATSEMPISEVHSYISDRFYD